MSTSTELESSAVASPSSLAALASVACATREWLTFRLGEEEYGIDILQVQEIRSYEKPTRIASSPAFIKGVVNLRGLIVPILDLRMKLGVSELRYDDTTVSIVLNVNGKIVGAVADSVSDVLDLKAGDVKPIPEMSASGDSQFVTGIGSVKSDGVDRMLILLDIAALIASMQLAKIAVEAVDAVTA
jgi:purine-binding chemotaxis protein CheW